MINKVLVVDDDPITLEMLAYAVESFGYQPIKASNGNEALELCSAGDIRIVVSDVDMPVMNGNELCREIRRRATNGYIYVLLLTSHKDQDSIIDSLDAGADNFISKPFHPAELRLHLLAGQRLVALESRDLIIFSMAKLAESRDTDTGKHLERIQAYCRALADELAHDPEFKNNLDGQYIQLLYMTSPLHDIGKVGIPDAILLKPGKLSQEEFEVMKKHTLIGGDTLMAAAEAYPEANFLKMAVEIALTHHEKWNGSGYPNGLKGEEIPLSGRIVAVADVYDALRAQRVYKPAYTHDAARTIITESSGSHFDPRIVDAFLRIEDQFDKISAQLAECY